MRSSFSMDVWMKTFRKCPSIHENQPVLIPGDPEKKAFDERSQNGIPVKKTVCCDLVEIATECNIELPFDLDTCDLKGVKRVVIDST